MNAIALDWDTIDRIAAEKGAKAEARRKWMVRKSVPYQWRCRIAAALAKDGKVVDIEAFDALFPGEKVAP